VEAAVQVQLTADLLPAQAQAIRGQAAAVLQQPDLRPAQVQVTAGLQAVQAQVIAGHPAAQVQGQAIAHLQAEAHRQATVADQALREAAREVREVREVRAHQEAAAQADLLPLHQVAVQDRGK